MTSTTSQQLLDAFTSRKPKTFLIVSGNKTDDLAGLICQAFKSSQTIDFYDQPTVGDVSVVLTNLEDQDVLIMKNLDVWSAELIENAELILQKTFSERQIHLGLSNGKITKIDLANFHILVTCNQLRRIPETFLRVFDEVFNGIEIDSIEPVKVANPRPNEKPNEVTKNNTKNQKSKESFLYKGETYGKSRLVWEIISDLIQIKKVRSFAELEGYFPKTLQGSRGCFATIEAAEQVFKETGHKRYFIAPQEILTVGKTKIAVCNQWGSNFLNFLNQAKALGFEVDEYLSSNDLPEDNSSDEGLDSQPETEIVTDYFADMRLTSIVKNYLDPLELDFQVGWEDDRTLSQFGADLEIEEKSFSVYFAVSEVDKNVEVFFFFKSLPKIAESDTSKIKHAIELIQSHVNEKTLIGESKFKLVEDDGSIIEENGLVIRFYGSVSESKNQIDNDTLESLFANAIRMVGGYSEYFSSIISNKQSPEEAYALIDFSDEDYNDENEQDVLDRHLLTVSFRREESYVFSSIKNAKNFENSKILVFEFNPDTADDENQEYHIKAVPDLTQLKPDSLNINRTGKVVEVSAEYIFQVEVDANCDCDAFDEWAQEQGGWSTAYFEPDAEWEVNDDHQQTTYFGTRNQWGFTLDGNEEYGGTDMLMVNGRVV